MNQETLDRAWKLIDKLEKKLEEASKNDISGGWAYRYEIAAIRHAVARKADEDVVIPHYDIDLVGVNESYKDWMKKRMKDA